MAMSSAPTPESFEIEAYVRELAPNIHDVSCGERIGGGYDLWFKRTPSSKATELVINEIEFSTGAWQRVVRESLRNAE